MQYDFFLAWRNLRARPVHTLITTLVIALAVALPVTVLALGDGARQGIIRASDPFGVLVVGAKGSAQQLVINSLLLQGVPVGNIPIGVYDSLRADPRVSLVVPLAFGDNVGGARIIGTSDALLELRPTVSEPPAFRVRDGRFFTDDFEAVLGSRAAQALGLGIGDTFLGAHGVERGLEQDTHDEPYTVVGVFEPTNTPYDSAVFVSVESVHEAHAHDEGEDDPLAAFAADDSAGEEQVTALLVKPIGFADANRIWQDFYAGTVAQAAFPGAELGELFNLFSIAERILTAVGYLVLGMGTLTVFLSMYSAIAAREQSIAVMRGVGGGRADVFRIVIIETLVLMLVGALIGRVVGYAAAYGLAAALTQQSNIPIPIRFQPGIEPLLWLLTVGFGLLAGLLPALRAYRINVVEKLFPA